MIDPALAPDLPDWVEPVAPASRAHLAMMGRARHMVSNSTVLGFHRKRPGTTFLQTWHGTPLKRIGFDIPRDGSRAARQAVATLRHNVQRWDLLLSPNRYSTPILREAFGYDGPDRGDRLPPQRPAALAPTRRRSGSDVRARLGIEPGKRVVLYAPTFRDAADFALEPEVDRMRPGARPGRTWCCCAPTRSTPARARPGHFVDVSGYPDNRELFLAADVLVTDYSSVMFDFAVTGKPMVFFTYDLEHYRDRARGFYFDFEAEAPGPLVTTAEDVAAAVAGADAGVASHREAYDRFVERFCHLEDGHAAARVVDLMLGG